MTTSLPSTEPAFSDTASQPDEQQITIPRTFAASQSLHSIKAGEAYPLQQMADPEAGAFEKPNRADVDVRTKISSLLKEKEREWTAVVEKQGPLRLLDLPMDLLKEIVKEVTHTNDLTALALTHSALHNIAIPHIYSRFDIVWPDAHATTDPRTGVDALTYGLATLCMGDVSRGINQGLSVACMKCGTINTAECNHGQGYSLQNGHRRIGNQYPQFTRKFSLGNGPPDWVQEYLITKESGKMLGTLVALAVARMYNLETFVWDMPTGVLRDVWLALSSLQHRSSRQECRLERVWVRWHDNSDPAILPPTQNVNATSNATSQLLAGSTMTSIGWSVPAGSATSLPHSMPHSQSRVEYPTLSVLPPLKSLSVLDIDELDYLDEMSVLIAKSKECLRELRVGISATAVNRDFALAWDGPDFHQVDHKAEWPGANSIGERRLGGVLGIILGRVFDIRRKQKVKAEKKDMNVPAASSTPVPPESDQMQANITSPGEVEINLLQNPAIEEDEPEKVDATTSEAPLLPPVVTFNMGITSTGIEPGEVGLNSQHMEISLPDQIAQSDTETLTALIAAHEINEPSDEHTSTIPQSQTSTECLLRRNRSHSQRQSYFSESTPTGRESLDGKLRLQTLELERTPLSIAVLQRAFDWSVLTSLTILDCAQHDRLWVMLRRHFQPTPLGGSHSSSKHGSGASVQHHLNLRKVHTDAASPSLISFLKETLAPNTLETLFLQDRKRSSGANVTIDAIFRGPLKRHRASLKRLMLDSSDRIPKGPVNSSDNARWRAWMPNRDILNFITSGRMSNLRELSIAIDYKDWHHFLQRLPQVPQLRSLNIPFIADHVTSAFDPRELALQVVDVIVLRPEVELCYMGVSHKCFEILENRPHDEVNGSTDTQSSTVNGVAGGVMTDDDDEDEDEDEDASDDEEEEEGADNGTAIGAPIGIDPEETESELSDQDDSDSDSFDDSEDGRSKIRLRLREILFYDDKVAIFKARHGRL